MVNERHLDEWVEVRQVIVIHEPLEVGHQPNDLVRVLRRYEDCLPAPFIFQGSAGRDPEGIIAILQEAEHVDEGRVRDEPACLDQSAVSKPQGIAVAGNFLGSR
ncbi:hypothetical protein GCM10017322_21720 [Paracoccus aerius]|nr:hypothetical protein GCM10017322_21720 [Paracoccus aerius]